LHAREGGVELLDDPGGVDGRPLGERHDRDERRDVAAVPVGLRDLAVHLERLAPRHRDLLRERADRRPDRGEGGDRDHEPEAGHQPLVREDPAGHACHRVSFRHGLDDQFEFEFALDLILDGFERLRDAA
jgi:hypothetical protein